MKFQIIDSIKQALKLKKSYKETPDSFILKWRN